MASWTFDSTAMTFDNTRYFMDGYFAGVSPTPPALPVPTIEGRGAWILPGGAQCIWVMGSGVFLMTVNTPPLANTPATFNIVRIGTMDSTTGQVGIRDNGAGGVVVIVDGTITGYFYVFSAAGSAVGPIGTFTKITDPDFLGADKVVFIDGWWIFNQPGTQNFYTPTATYSTKFNAGNYALDDAATDLLVSIHENKEELWLFGERHTEIWYDAGGTYFAFQRLVSTMLQVGCAAKHSVARFNTEGEDGLIWLAKSERGQNVVVKTVGYAYEVVSTPAINHAIASYQKVDDAIAYAYQSDGHEFYVLTFPSADATWVYDGSTRLWHQRLAYDPYLSQWHRHRSNCFANFQNQRLVGDYQNGSIYALKRDVYTDGTYPLVAWRRSPHVWDGGARERVFVASLQVEFRPGVGQQTGTTTPEAFLTISRDGGATFGSAVAAPLGSVGQYKARTIWRRLGMARDLVFDLKVYDPVNRDIVGATLKRFASVDV
jgi:hypothetical protein